MLAALKKPNVKNFTPTDHTENGPYWEVDQPASLSEVGLPELRFTHLPTKRLLGTSHGAGGLGSEMVQTSLYVCAKSLELCPTLCNPMDCSLPGSSVHRILQARILEWVAMLSSRGIFLIWRSNACLLSPALADGFFTTSTTWEAPFSAFPFKKVEVVPLLLESEWGLRQL